MKRELKKDVKNIFTPLIAKPKRRIVTRKGSKVALNVAIETKKIIVKGSKPSKGKDTP